MDNSGDRVRHTGGVQPSPYQWSTPIGLVTCGWALTGAAALWWWGADTAVDRLFIGVIVAVLAAGSAIASFLRPRLRADARGVTLRGLTGTRHWRWAELTVRVVHTSRLGRSVESLELDAGGNGLAVLTRTDLGTDPQNVADALDSLRSQPS